MKLKLLPTVRWNDSRRGNEADFEPGTTPRSASSRRRLPRRVLSRFLWPLAAAFFLTGCNHHTSAPAPPPVTVAHPQLQPVTDSIDLSGTVTAFQTVDLVARVPGYLQSVNFADGAFVKAGQLLFVIEPAPYEEQLKLAEAALLQAQSEYDRQQELVKQNATSVANVEKWQSQRDQAAAQVALAKINLGYTRVTAPFDGRIGRHLVDPGNMVGADGNTKLATVDQITPIYVYFNLNERDALRIRNAMRERGMEPLSSVGKTPVLVGLQNEAGYPHEGALDFINSGVSTSSGTLQLRAVFTNDDRTLIPGVFARVRLPLGEPQPMLVVPNRVVGNDQEGDYVLVLGPGDIVARRSVVKGPLSGDDRAIQSGLTAEDRVIVNGLMNARPGYQVTPGTAPINPAP
ncbi:MAG TPA: efflux RND transporter periplasmic adaptor subunit [Verrucomicrobiae bacterium]|nr:efflux RND transporter periplasmic adaptor subunit [Verrucomicrobiae bacterium]